MEKMRTILIAIILITILICLIPTVTADDYNNTTSNSTSTYINVREIRFNCKDFMGRAIPEVNVTATAYESTMPDPIAWLLALFGVDTATVPINQTMNGTTGSDGSISFIMVPAYKYNMTFEHPEYTPEQIFIWPTEDDYLIILYQSESPTSAKVINATLYEEFIDENNINLCLNWTDTYTNTNTLNFFVKNESGVVVHSESYSTCGNKSCCYLATKSNSTYWQWGYNATHGDFPGTTFAETNGIRFEVALVPIEIDGEEISDLYYNWICISLLVLIAALFSKYNIRWGAIVVPLMADLFKLMWKFSYVPWLYLAIATVLGFLYFLRTGRDIYRV